jgi:hypothetical protein
MTRDRGTSRGGVSAEERLLREELIVSHREQTRLRLQSEQLVSSNRDLSTLLFSAERRAGELVKIIVAARRLLEARTGREALRSLEEILINVIGTEDFVVLSAVPDAKTLVPVGGMGNAHESSRRQTLSLDAFAECLHGGRRLFASTPSTWGGETPMLAACIPLRIMERVVGVIVIQRLLPHREALTAFDDELLTLLGEIAATIIIAADRRCEWTSLLVRDL